MRKIVMLLYNIFNPLCGGDHQFTTATNRVQFYHKL
jgi:hypothetical protein